MEHGESIYRPYGVFNTYSTPDHAGSTNYRRGDNWLITGGLGGLGLLFANWASMSTRQMINLVDVEGYSKLPPVISQCTSHDVVFKVTKGDISCAEDAFVATTNTYAPPIGIMHAAGVLRVSPSSQSRTDGLLIACMSL